MNAVLPKEMERFVQRQVKRGNYQSKSQVVRDALLRLAEELEGAAKHTKTKFPPGTLEAIYVAETAAERRWENSTAKASSLKAEAF